MSKVKKADANDFYELGSENVFADLEMPEAEEKLAKAKLAFEINKVIKQKKLKQVDAAKLLGVDQGKISLLSRGRLSDFSMERLVRYLTLLDCDVEIVVKKSKRRRQQHGSLSVTYA